MHPGPASGRQKCACLVHGQALARPSSLALWGIDQHGNVAPYKIPGLRMPYRPRQCIVAHRHGGGRVLGSHRRQRLAHIAGRQLTQSSGADGCKDRGENVLVLLDRLSGPAIESFLQPVFRRALDCVVRAGPQARFEVSMKCSQPILNDSLGFAGDLAADPFAVRPVSETDHSSPPARAVPVPGAVVTEATVLEEDPIFTPAAPRAHGFQPIQRGPSWGPFASHVWPQPAT